MTAALITAYKTFQSLEANHSVEKITYQNAPIWPLLRISLFSQLRDVAERANRPPETKFKKQILKSLWVSLVNECKALRRAPILFVSYDSELKNFNGQILNKHFYYIYQKYDPKECLYLEKPVSGNLTMAKNREKFVVSSLFLYVVEFVLRRMVPAPQVDGLEVLAALQRDSGIALNVHQQLKSYRAFRWLFRFWLRVWNPKIVYLTNHYNISHMALIAECRRRGIKVVEIQHGVINSQHPGYSFFNSAITSDVLKPDVLLTFGQNVSKCISPNFAHSVDIVPCGHSYLSYVYANRKTTAPAQATALVTLQKSNLKAILQFVNQIAKLNPNVEFHLLPRRADDVVHYVVEHQNVKIVSGDFYQLVQAANVHVTGFSTCAMEAPVFGVPNILIDHDGMASFYYQGILPAGSINQYVQTPEDFGAAYANVDRDRRSVTEKSKDLIFADFPERFARHSSDSR